MPRPRKPLEDRLLDGTYVPSRHGPLPSEAPVAPEKLRCPDSLSGRAAEIWREQVKQLAGVVRKRDIPVLAELCRWIERSERIAEALDSLDPTAKEFKGLLIAAGIATDKVAALAKVFGITPADRAKVKEAAPAGSPKQRVPVVRKSRLNETNPVQ